jgi:AcrR family transcriptional regulator
MRARLLEAAMVVLGQRGVEASVIDDIAALAAVSRGTFYNYFRSNEELLQSLAIETGNEMMRAVAPVVESRPDPAWRVSAGVRGWLTLTGENPHLAAFFRRAGLYILEQDSLVRVDMPRDLALGMGSGRFTIDKLELGFDIVGGTVLSAINTIANGVAPPNHGSAVAQRILMGLGVPAGEAEAIACLDIEKATLSDNSLIIRSGRLTSGQRDSA